MSHDKGIRPVVVIPVHRPTPSPSEVVSLRQAAKALAHREIVILAPEGLDLGAYHCLLPGAGEFRVPPGCMASIQAYNRMMISPLVFNAVSGYSHMLLHEPDAIVLRDDLDYWCAQPQDYVGAPWFEGWGKAVPGSPIIGVGNFGLSLHRLDASRRVMASRQRWYPYRQAVRDLIDGTSGNAQLLARGVSAFGRAGQLRGAGRLYTEHCDIFWSRVVPGVERTFRVAPIAAALNFAWEVLPARCMEMCNGALPFGIHAWAKYDFNFLAPLLVKAGVDLDGFESSS